MHPQESDLGRGLQTTTPQNPKERGIDSLHTRTLTRHKSESSFQHYAKRAKAAAAEQADYLTQKVTVQLKLLTVERHLRL